ncbi:MAG: glycogen/starch synthase [Vicinamibacterales bacterium]|nr:glycogen/starch synthase [Vicinamibacterales bacterium]
MPEKTTKRAGRTTPPSPAKTTLRAAVTPAAPKDEASATPVASSGPAEAHPAPVAEPAAVPPARKAPARAAKKTEPATAKKAAAPRAKKVAAPGAKKAAAPKTPAAPRAKTGAKAPSAMTPEVTAPAPVTTSGRSLSILIVASEAAPFSRTGGLGELAGGLPAALGALGHTVTLVVPKYAGEAAGVPVDRFAVRLGGHSEEAACYEVALGTNARAILVEHAGFFEREFLYGDREHDYADNPRRFAFLCRAALEFAARAGERIDVVHAHDWQTALAPVLLRTEYGEAPALSRAASVLTIHDVAFQGLCDREWMGMLDLSPSLFTLDGLEFWGRVSFLKGGIVYADVVTTIGKAYARSLVSGDRPSGLEGLLASRGETFTGVVDDTATEQPSLPSIEDLAGRFADLYLHAGGTRAALA